MGSTFLHRLNFYLLPFPAPSHLTQAFCVSSFLYLFSLSILCQVWVCPAVTHMTLTFRVCFYTLSFSAVYRFFFFNLLCCTPPVILVHPDRLCLLILTYRVWHALYCFNLLSSFFSETSLPYPIFSFSFWILPLPKVYPSLVSPPLLACLKSFLPYHLTWTHPTFSSCKKEKWLSGEALQIAVKRREAKSKGEK